MKKLLLYIIFVLVFNAGYAQDKAVVSDYDSVMARMRHVALFQATYPQEKVYIHFDNTAYFKGERIYFKANVIRADRGTATDLSKVLYVDLLNPSGDVVHKSKLKIENGEAHGDIPLDSIIGTGFFEVRAYTRYMLNFGEETAFSRVFPIFKKPEVEGDYSNPAIDPAAFYHRLPERNFTDDSVATLDPVEMKRRNGRDYQVNIYPEGGKLVKGLVSRVAFTVLDSDHHPVALLGEVVDADNSTLTVVESNTEGKGIFELIPTSTRLTMLLTNPEMKKLEFEMPEVLEEGVVMLVDAVRDGPVCARVMATDGMVGKFMAYTLMNNGNVYAHDTLRLSGSRDILFSRRRLRPGVNQLTLFDAKGHIHAERLFFVCPEANALDSIRIDHPTDTLKPCSPVRLTLHSAPNARFSLSAMDAGSLLNGKSGNIATYMLLASDVRGYIPNPEYYFESDDREHRLAADSLMLFNGWRRYDWEVMADVSPWRNGIIHQVEDQLYVYGRLKPSLSKWKKNNPVEGVDMSLYIYNKEGKNLTGETRTDSTGFYAFSLPDIEKLWNMQIVTKIEDKLKSYEVMVDRQFDPSPRYISLQEASQHDNAFHLAGFHADNVAFLKMDSQRAYMQQVGRNEYVTSPVRIKPKKDWRNFKSDWRDEYNAILHADLRYDAQKVAQDYADKGEPQPSVYDWLVEHTSAMDGTVNIRLAESDDERDYLYGSATYNNRDILWVVDNQFMGRTGKGISLDGEPVKFNWELEKLPPILPTFLDEVKSVYVSVSPGPVHVYESMRYYGRDAFLYRQELQPPGATVYIYTLPYYNAASKKGRRRTYFQGFDVPTKFKTEDYNILPPMPDDYRRTIWWQPEVVADENGDATVEFYNNSRCTDMYISAEGVTPDGRFVVSP